jgi:cbb3-type cytochrome c oxidase subunit III
MRKENYTVYLTIGLGLTLAILVTFQLYIFQEPDRIAAVEAHDKSVAFTAGQALFKKNCTLCHGDNGEGTRGRPSLNDKPFLTNTSDDRIFSIISSGVPNTEMPAWNQSHGGPLTDEDVLNLVAFIRAWEPNAPDRRATPPVGSLTRGRSLYANVCAVCHGKDGEGVNGIVALNDPAKLKQFDDTWYGDVITKGRPAQGMPTWGTVLSPEQVADLLALLDTWRQSAAAATPLPTAVATESAAGGPAATAAATATH